MSLLLGVSRLKVVHKYKKGEREREREIGSQLFLCWGYFISCELTYKKALNISLSSTM